MKIFAKIRFVLFITACFCWTGCAAQSQSAEPAKSVPGPDSIGATRDEKTIESNPVDTILEKLNQATTNLKTYSCRIEYKFTQPLLDSQTLRKGMLYYEKKDKQSNLRINFETLKQDQEQEQKQIEQYIFDGVWLTHINYQLKEVKKHQLAEPNKPTDTFELVSSNLPIIGFSKVENLKKQFEITTAEKNEMETATYLHLKVKPDSIYKNDYTVIDFWIDNRSNLPVKIVTTSTEGDIYEIRLLDAGINKELDKRIFEINIPKDFGEPVIVPLNK
jgi:outer membrane lipoprotein-sorting protein